MKINDKEVTVKLLDSPGQNRFLNVNIQHCLISDGIIFVFDITNRDSFDSIHGWLLNITSNSDSPIKSVLVGNKTDLEKDRKISTEMGAQFANENKYYFKETSCVTISNVVDAFETIIVMTHNDMFKNEQIPTRNTIRLSKVNNNEPIENNSNKGKKKKCC